MSSSGATFRRGGAHPPDNKQLCDSASYTVLKNPAELTIALAQHLGAPAKPVVKNRDVVEAGQLVGESGGFVSANIHTPLAGTVRSLGKVHMGAVNSPSVVIKTSPDAAPLVEYELDAPTLDLDARDAKEIISEIKDAGIVGAGGAAFPTHVKLNPPPGVELDVLIINGAECEPYLTADDCLMRGRPLQVLEGARAVMKACSIERCIIGIEDNKPDAFHSMSANAESMAGVEVMRMKTRYPQGSEKQLIEAAAGRRVAPGQLPFTQGVVVQNVTTMAAIYEKLQYDRPMMRRLVSVSGRAVVQPQNILVPVGATVEMLLEHCGGLKGDCAAVVMGGPMMGRTTTDMTEPINKGTSGILFLAPEEVELRDEDPCIRCGECLTVCPMGLVPTEIASLSEKGRFMEAIDAMDCIECGTCAYVCPSSRRLVQWIRLAKYEIGRIRRREQERAKLDEAKVGG